MACLVSRMSGNDFYNEWINKELFKPEQGEKRLFLFVHFHLPQSHLFLSRTTSSQHDGNAPPVHRIPLIYRPKVRARKRRKKRRRKRKRKRRAAGDGIAVGTVAWRNVRCEFGTWAWASTRMRLSSSSFASAPARGLVGTTTWLCALCWPTAVCPSAPPGRLAHTLAAAPRAMNRSPSWMLQQPGEPSSPSPQRTVSAWDEATWKRGRGAWPEEMVQWSKTGKEESGILLGHGYRTRSDGLAVVKHCEEIWFGCEPVLDSPNLDRKAWVALEYDSTTLETTRDSLDLERVCRWKNCNFGLSIWMAK